MTYRYILGTGTMAKGTDEPYAGALSMIENLPVKDYINSRAGRRYGRLTKLITIAAHRALAEAEIADPSKIPVAAATCIGETHAALGILEQIHQTKGVTLSPALIPNSVHNAAAGYLSIGLKNHAPSLTVSQGWLSVEAALAAADDMMAAGLHDCILAAAGDEAMPAWADRLVELGDSDAAERLRKEAFEEGAASVVLGTTPGDKSLGSVAAGVERWGNTAEKLPSLLSRNGIDLSPYCLIRLRQSAGGAALLPLTAAAFPGATVTLDGEGAGTVQTGSLTHVIQAARGNRSQDLLLLGAEADEIGFVHWKPANF